MTRATNPSLVPQPKKIRRAFVVRTQPNRERVAQDFLTRFGFSVYLPMMQVTIRHARKTQQAVRPFLPMYMFLWDDGDCDLMRVRNAPGVSGHLRWGKQTAYAVEHAVNKIKARENVNGLIVLDDLLTTPSKFIKDEIIKIDPDCDSAFRGFDAIFQYRIDEERVAVFLNIFGRLSQVTMAYSDLQKV